MTRSRAAVAEIVHGPPSTGVRAPLEAVSFLEPVKLMLRSLKVARPAESLVRVAVPLSEPTPALKVMATDTPDTLLPKLSVTWTLTDGGMAAPAVAAVGCWVKANWLGAAGEIEKARQS